MPGKIMNKKIFFLTLSFVTAGLGAEPLPVHYPEGLAHGFLRLSTPQGQVLAEGDLKQELEGDHVKATLVFQFKDGSSQQETMLFSQRQNFKLLHYQLRQHGPAFSRAIELELDQATGWVEVSSLERGKKKAF